MSDALDTILDAHSAAAVNAALNAAIAERRKPLGNGLKDESEGVCKAPAGSAFKCGILGTVVAGDTGVLILLKDRPIRVEQLSICPPMFWYFPEPGNRVLLHRGELQLGNVTMTVYIE